jgi:hypothetical protein
METCGWGGAQGNGRKRRDTHNKEMEVRWKEIGEMKQIKRKEIRSIKSSSRRAS